MTSINPEFEKNHERGGDPVNRGRFSASTQSAPDATLEIVPGISGALLDSLEDSQLATLHRHLADRIGSTGPTVDIFELKYRLIDEPNFYGFSEESVSSAKAKYATEREFLLAITETAVFDSLNEWSDAFSSDVTETITQAIDELNESEAGE